MGFFSKLFGKKADNSAPYIVDIPDYPDGELPFN